jgi:glycerate-2-kinase
LSRRALLESLFRTGVAAVEGGSATARALAPGDCTLHLLAAGKAACAMARGAVGVLGDRLAGGLAVTKDGHGTPVAGIEVIEASHPLPDARSVAAAERALETAAALDREVELLVLISGGASALWTAPVEGVSLDSKRALTDQLLRAGAGIEDLNAVRKHLSRIKGGGLARAARSRRIRTLALSDVRGDRLDVIGSGPTAPDPTTYADALRVLDRFAVTAPADVRAHLAAGARGERPETPKPGDPGFERVEHHIVGSLAVALDAVEAAAIERGLRVVRLPEDLYGEARDCGRRLAERARSEPGSGPVLLLAGGEPTVTVRGPGRGGRAQEAALALALAIEGEPDVAALVCGSDGTDGPTDAAGACVDGESVRRARAAGLDAQLHLERNDAYPLLQASGDLIFTGPTDSNVTDLALVAVGWPAE